MDLLPAALKATSGQHWAVPALYIVATPIGNLADITARALACLAMADVLAAEDTRVAQKLFAAYGITPKQLVRCDAHREEEACAQLIAALASGKRVALVSDAGTPAVSDPGARVVAAVRAAGYAVVPLPGASAVLTLLSAAGIADTPFSFVGFAPTKASEMDAWLEQLQTARTTTVFFEAPQRAAATLAKLAQALSPLPTSTRRVVIGRELTKRFETIKSLLLIDAAQFIATENKAMQGEWVIAVAPAEPMLDTTGDEAAHDGLLQKLLAHLPLKTAVQLAAELSGAHKNALYERALLLKNADGVT